MMNKLNSNRSEKEVIIIGLSVTYSICVGIFAAIRFYNGEQVIGTLDLILALFGLYVFSYVWRTRTTTLPALAISIISVLGTVATIVLKGSDQVYWAYPSVALVFYLLPTRQALILWSLCLLVIISLLINLPVFKLVTISMTLIITSFFCHLFSSKMYQQHDRLRKQANQDVLTLIKNRRAFNQDTSQLEDVERPVSVILFDLDNFKQVNDYFGHNTGDLVLKQTSTYVANLIDDEGVLYRIGGDEFAIICNDSDFNKSYQLAKNLHAQFAQSDINKEHKITLSLAVAQKDYGESVKEWLGRLDSALYKAKKSGRNQIVKAIRY